MLETWSETSNSFVVVNTARAILAVKPQKAGRRPVPVSDPFGRESQHARFQSETPKHIVGYSMTYMS